MNHSLIPSLRFENYHTDWCYFPMKAFADIDKTSLKKDTDSNFEFSYISLSDVKNQKISRELERHTFNDAPSRARRIIKSGDILFSTVRPNLQGFALVCNEYKNCIASTGFAVISTDETTINLLGGLNDPELGKVDCGIVTQLRLSSEAPNFGNIADITVDSVVLSFVYDGRLNYGNLEALTFEVFEVRYFFHNHFHQVSQSILLYLLGKRCPLIIEDYQGNGS